MSDSQNGPVVLLTGGSGGIGSAIVKELVSHGYRLSLGSQNPGSLTKVHGAETSQLLYTNFDAFDHESAKQWVTKTFEHYGGIDVLVNNAGIGERVSIYDENEEALDRLFEVNVKTPLRLTRLCLPYLERCGKGRIINMGSLAGKRVRNSAVGYSLSKFALMGVSHATRTLTWSKGVRVTAVCPGWVKTEMNMKSETRKIEAEDMISPDTVAHLVRTAIELPNSAAVAELLVNCEFEDML